MFSEKGLIPPKYLFTIAGNRLSEMIIQKLMGWQFELAPQCKRLPCQFCYETNGIVEAGIYVFDCPVQNNDDHIKFLFGNGFNIPMVFGERPFWAVKVFPFAAKNIEKAAMEVKEAFRVGNFEKQARQECFPWGERKRMIIG